MKELFLTFIFLATVSILPVSSLAAEQYRSLPGSPEFYVLQGRSCKALDLARVMRSKQRNLIPSPQGTFDRQSIHLEWDIHADFTVQISNANNLVFYDKKYSGSNNNYLTIDISTLRTGKYIIKIALPEDEFFYGSFSVD